MLLLIEAHLTLFEKATTRIKAVHCYTMPGIVALLFAGSFAGYLDWIGEGTA